jgi:hypothetical protein
MEFEELIYVRRPNTENIEVGYVFLFSPASILLIILYDQSMIGMINNLFEFDYPITILDIVDSYFEILTIQIFLIEKF